MALPTPSPHVIGSPFPRRGCLSVIQLEVGRRKTRKRGERPTGARHHGALTLLRFFAFLAPRPLPSRLIATSGSDRRHAAVTPGSSDSTPLRPRPVSLPTESASTALAAPAMAMSSPMVLSLLLFVSLTALLLLAPRLSPPPTPAAVASAAEEEVPAVMTTAAAGAVGGAGAEDTPGVWGGGVGEEPDDLRLFRRAALEAGDTAAGPPKVAFLFLTNSDLTFAPLWERFFAGNEARLTVYVHADPAERLRLPPTPSFRGRFVAAKPTRRADASLISAARRLLAAALLDDAANTYFALLSQHCVPLHSFARLYAALFPPPAAARSSRHRRLPSYIEVLTGEPQMPWRYVARGEDAMLPEVPYGRFRIGSQFFTLARRHAVLVVRERRLWGKFRLPCLPEAREHNCYPEEHYFPTLLDMADPAGVARYTLTRVNWTGSVAGHPHTYTAPEVTPQLIAELRTSNHTHPHMFARKFAPDCLGPLMAMADAVIFKD